VIGPSNLRVYLRAGQIYELAGNPQKALQAYQRASQISPENLEALQALERIKHTH
jgi:cytochrome c-type biogenesis protein CcmH/NrfG